MSDFKPRFTGEPNRLAYIRWHQQITDVFTGAGLTILSVVESPNRYCRDDCCPHLPAVTVTTNEIGPVDFWWRKRVMALDWSASRATAMADDLFADQDVTKGDRHIHCWSEAKAIFNLVQIKRSVPQETPHAH